MTDARSPMRALRAALFAAVCVALAAVGHSYMSGHDIPFVALLVAFGITGGVGWLAGGRRRGALSIGSVLLTVQGAVHLIFTGSQPHGAAPSAMAKDGVMAHEQPAGAESAGMLAAHLLAAVICALWLARGEAALFQLVGALGVLAFTPLRLLTTAVRLPETPASGRRPRPRGDGVRPRTAELAHVVSRRGPPATYRRLCHAPIAL